MTFQITTAINTKTFVSFIYNGVKRKVAIHTLGFNKNGLLACRGYQIYNAATNPNSGFKLFFICDMEDLILLYGDTFTRKTGYVREDNYFKAIIAQL